jgi:hypothetical protein
MRSSAENGGAPVPRGPCHDPARETSAVASAAALRLWLGGGAAEQRPGPPGANVGFCHVVSGAVMANQPHIAHSAEIMGAAMIASGLYGCAVLHATADGVGAQASQAAGPCLSSQ